MNNILEPANATASTSVSTPIEISDNPAQMTQTGSDDSNSVTLIETAGAMATTSTIAIDGTTIHNSIDVLAQNAQSLILMYSVLFICLQIAWLLFMMRLRIKCPELQLLLQPSMMTTMRLFLSKDTRPVPNE